ncbi:MAG: HypC/HybG/HupF family hydrogenase formation chaperone [Planctomycetota bacterium]
MTGDRGIVALDGNRANVSLVLVPEARQGDWVLVHAGYAITVLDEAEAKVTYDLLKQMDERALRLEEPERD